MGTLTITPPELAQEIWYKLQYWQQRATELEAIEVEEVAQGGQLVSFVLSGDEGAFRCSVMGSGVRLFWSSLSNFPSTIDVHPYKVTYKDGTSLASLTIEISQALCDMLEPGTVEVATGVDELYGFVVDDRIVAVTFTTDVNQSSLDDRVMLGLNADTYVADPVAYGRLCAPTGGSIVAWYQQFWQLKQRGVIVRLSERVNSSLRQTWARREGPDVWLEFGATGTSPKFLKGVRYRSWLVASNEPSIQERSGEQSVKNPLRGWFK